MKLKQFAVLALLAGACAPSGPVHAALYGDLPSLREQIAQAAKGGKLDRRATVELAEAVASREVVSAQGKSGARHVRALSACARPLLPSLRRRAEVHDEAGAEAMLVLLSLRATDPDVLVQRYAGDRDGSWRAVAARSARTPNDVLQRRSWFVDPDERVRRAALEAAETNPDPSDAEALLEAFRLDPDPLSRSLAARAAGAIGGEAVVLGLRDRFDRADEAGQLTIIEAWAMPAAYKTGGARELTAVMDTQHGIVAVAAAAALLRSGEKDGRVVGFLASTIEHGSDDERRLAIMLAPSDDPRVAQALDRAANDNSPEVRVMVWSLFLSSPARRMTAFQKLRQLAVQTDPPAFEAQAALARAGDRVTIPALTTEAQKGAPARRGSAAVALFRLGETSKAALALGDADPGVRVAAACGIISAKR
jgi:HEAT repeat protein